MTAIQYWVIDPYGVRVDGAFYKYDTAKTRAEILHCRDDIIYGIDMDAVKIKIQDWVGK